MICFKSAIIDIVLKNRNATTFKEKLKSPSHVGDKQYPEESNNIFKYMIESYSMALTILDAKFSQWIFAVSIKYFIEWFYERRAKVLTKVKSHCQSESSL